MQELTLNSLLEWICVVFQENNMINWNLFNVLITTREY